MTAIEILIDLIKKYEGCKLEAYRCPAGKLTVGWGYTGPDVTESTVWSQQYADAMLRKRANQALDEALAASPLLRHESVEKMAAIADFVYNLGQGNYIRSTLKKCVDRGDWPAAEDEIVKWTKANGKVLQGLVKRRAEERDLLDAD